MNLHLPSCLSNDASTILSELAEAYGFDLSQESEDIYLRLELDNYMPLVLERHEAHVISLSHYVEQNGDLMSDPDVSFLIRASDSEHLLIILFNRPAAAIFRRSCSQSLFFCSHSKISSS